jgi:hypothetical protein
MDRELWLHRGRPDATRSRGGSSCADDDTWIALDFTKMFGGSGVVRLLKKRVGYGLFGEIKPYEVTSFLKDN